MRNDAREAAFKIIFASLFHDGTDQNFRAAIYRSFELSEEEREFAEKLVQTVSEHREEFTQTISERVERFADYRIFPVEKSVMLLALAEIKYFDDIPPVVSVSEAAAMAKKYSSEKAADFVNGVLGSVINA